MVVHQILSCKQASLDCACFKNSLYMKGSSNFHLLSPRQGEPSDEVRLRGEPKLVARLQAELEKLAATLRDRVILAVDVPAPQHRALIGRGGQHLNDLQAKFNVQVQFPGSRSYHQVGEAENIADFVDVDAANIVKVSGSRSACESAIEQLKVSIPPRNPQHLSSLR